MAMKKYKYQLLLVCISVTLVLQAAVVVGSKPPKDKHCKADKPGDDGYLSHCAGTIKCPESCPDCHLSCKFCGMAHCPKCDKVGSVCQDPRFIGGDGQIFYFHGYKDSDFCLVSDKGLHINAHFIGKRTANRTRDFTWVQALGILFDTHKFYVGSKRVGKWDSSVDQFVLYFDGYSISLPSGEGSKWVSPNREISIVRVENANYLNVEITGLLNSSIGIVPVTKEDSRVHKYEITDADCFAHLELNFDFFKLTDSVSGVLGQSYAPSFVNPVKKGVPMPLMGGEKKFMASSIFTPDCEAAQFKAIHHSSIVDTGLGRNSKRLGMPSAVCSSNGGKGSGFVCKR